MSATLPVSLSTVPGDRSEHDRFLRVLALVIVAGLHAIGAVWILSERFFLSKCYFGGFRLLGTPTSSFTDFFIHVDFVVFLLGALWLAYHRWTYSRPTMPATEGVDWTRSHRWGLGGVLIAGAVLLLWDLGGPDLWQDEAQSALISQTVLQTGLPLGTDGKNYFSQEFGAEYADGYLWRWHTWLPFYVTAGSFSVFGETTFAARFPGALFGWISIWLTYQAALELWKDRRTALCAAGVLTLGVAFLLLSRQCRYYSALMCFTLMSLIGYWRVMRSERGGHWLLISGMTCLFHTHYVYTGICGAAFIIDCLLSHRRRWKALAVSALAVVVLALPWVFWFLQMKYGDRYGERTFNLLQSWEDLDKFARLIAADMVPFLLWPIPAVLWYLRKKLGIVSSRQTPPHAEILLGILIVLHVLMLAPIIPWAYTRYLAPIIPLTAMLIGRWLSEASRIHKSIAIWIGSVLLLSWPCADFVREQLQPVTAPGRVIRDYLAQHAKPGELIVTSYGDLPMKFYLPQRVMGGLTGEDLSNIEPPPWIIPRRYRFKSVDKQLLSWIYQGNYQAIELPAPDTPFEFREEPQSHLFMTDWSERKVTIFRRIDPPQHASNASPIE